MMEGAVAAEANLEKIIINAKNKTSPNITRIGNLILPFFLTVFSSIASLTDIEMTDRIYHLYIYTLYNFLTLFSIIKYA
ncbi:MAG: hypothetical protein G01um101413_964 [Parcubacteria group bacterium Gr01-1014_13]|nr:MAG: hypothetical protein G01um101413_964 [Parcubacteria group bacterium Gr01-1014_13]